MTLYNGFALIKLKTGLKIVKLSAWTDDVSLMLDYISCNLQNKFNTDNLIILLTEDERISLWNTKGW